MAMTYDGTNGITFPDSSLQKTAGYSPFRNRIINGGMQVWQRGTSGFTTPGNYCTDRWFATAGTSLSAVGQSTDVPSGFKYSLSVAGTNYPQAQQKIESVNCTDLAGQTVTVSFWAKLTAGAGSNSIFCQLFYANAVDNWGASTLISSVTNINGTSSWAQYTVTFSSLPASVANGLCLVIGANTTGAATILFTGVQLEKGSVATPFEYRPYSQELALCQRYYQTYTGFGVDAYQSAGQDATGRLSFPVVMRTSPTVLQPGSPNLSLNTSATVFIIGAGSDASSLLAAMTATALGRTYLYRAVNVSAEL